MAVQRQWKWWQACPQCGGTIEWELTVPQGRLGQSHRPYGVYECQRCRCAFLNPMPVGDLSWLYPPAYLSGSDTATGIAAWYRQDQYAFDFRLWERASSKSLSNLESYLDVGAGSGERVAFLQSQSVPVVVGIDQYDQQPTAGQAEIKNMSVEAYRPKKKFALIGLFHVLEHVSEPKLMLEQIFDYQIAEGGEIIIQVPNFASIERKIFGRRWFGLDVPRHLWHFTPHTLQQLVESTGFTVLDVYQENAFLHPVTTTSSIASVFDIQRLWVERTQMSVGQYWWRFFGWGVLTILTIPWSFFLSLFSQGSMLTVVARKE